MKNIKQIIAVFALMPLMPLSALADNPPAMPLYISGSVKIDGVLAPIGIEVTAEAGGRQIASASLEEAGEYYMNNISEDTVPVGNVITFRVNGVIVPDTEGKFRMVDVANTPSVEYDLSVTIQNNSGSGSGNSGGGVGGSSSGGSSSGGSSGGGGGSSSGSGGSNTNVSGGGGNSASSNSSNSGTTATSGNSNNNSTSGNSGNSSSENRNGEVKGATSVNVADGDIIQCKSCANPSAVYIVKVVNGKKFIRHIVSLQIFNHYKHLKWENLIQVDSLDGFSLSGWVRVNTGPNGTPGPNDKVYEINGDQTRHWIDMTAEEFLRHGGSEEAIFNINAGELALYKEGAAVKLQ